MYPYLLGIQFNTGKLVRIFDPFRSRPNKIPQGFGLVLKLRSCLMIQNRLHCSGPKVSPYEDGQLKLQYWSLNRNTDLEKQLDR